MQQNLAIRALLQIEMRSNYVVKLDKEPWMLLFWQHGAAAYEGFASWGPFAERVDKLEPCLFNHQSAALCLKIEIFKDNR